MGSGWRFPSLKAEAPSRDVHYFCFCLILLSAVDICKALCLHPGNPSWGPRNKTDPICIFISVKSKQSVPDLMNFMGGFTSISAQSIGLNQKLCALMQS